MNKNVEPHENFNSEDEELRYYGKVYESVLNKLDAVNTSLKDWLSHLLMIAATLLGVLVTLSPVKQTNPICIRICFLLAVLLLVFVLLLGGVSLYGVVFEKRTHFENYAKELGESVKSHRKMRPTMPDGKRVFSICETGSYICFGLFFLVLILYLILSLFDMP